MKKRLLALLLVAAMAVGAGACGNKASSDSDKENDKNEEVENKTDDEETDNKETDEGPEDEDDSLYPIVEEPITITGVTMDKGWKDPDNNTRDTWDAIAELTGITVEWTVVTDVEQLGILVASGEWPDLWAVDRSDFGKQNVYDYGVLGGKFVNYAEYLDIMPNYAAVLEEYPDARKATTYENGEIYELVAISKGDPTACETKAHFRLDLLEDAGLEEPTSVEELYECLKVLKEKNGGAPLCVYGGLDERGGWGNAIFSAFGTLCNANFVDDGDGNVVYGRTSEQYKLYLEYMHKLYSEGLLNNEYLTLDLNGALALANEGTTVFMGGEANSLTEEAFADGQFHLGTIGPLTSEYSDDTTLRAWNAIYLMSTCMMSVDCEYKEEVCKMLDILFAKEEVVEGSGLYGMAGGAGIEGVHFTFNEDGTWTQNLPEDFDGTWYDYMTNVIKFNTIGYVDYQGYMTDTPGNYQERCIGYNEKVHPYMEEKNSTIQDSFLSFTEEEQSVITNKLVDVQTYIDEMKVKFIAGVVDIDNGGWEEYLETLDDMGLQDIMNAYQAAYDRFNA